MQTLAELIPSVYSQSDADGSLATFVAVYDETHAEQLGVMESLSTVRTPGLAPTQFITDIADSLGNPFAFMTADRWQRGNKLNALPYIYSRRGSAKGIQDVILFLTGVPVVIEDASSFVWILGVSLLGDLTVSQQSEINSFNESGQSYSMVIAEMSNLVNHEL